MIYAIRQQFSDQTLQEFSEPMWNEMFCRHPFYSQVSEEAAHQWVRDGRVHETGLFINDDGKVVYAEAEG